MISIFRNHRLTFLLYACFLISGLVLITTVPKLELHTLLNSHHTEMLDVFFRVMTFLGNGWFATIIAILFLMVRFRYALMVAAASLASGFLVQFLKRVVFPGCERPASCLEQMPGLPLVDGVALHHHLSFPSGHATTAFAVLMTLALVSGRQWVSFPLVFIACMVAGSRVYLSQHFLADIMAGSVIGILSAVLIYWYFQKQNGKWLDKSIFRIR